MNEPKEIKREPVWDKWDLENNCVCTHTGVVRVFKYGPNGYVLRDKKGAPIPVFES